MQIFEEKAREIGNVQAINFIQWWKSKMSQIRSDKLTSVFFGKRNISVHRRVVRPDLKKNIHYETFNFTDSVTIRKYDERGNLIEEVKSSQTIIEPEKHKPTEIDWYFLEDPDENVLEASRKLLEILKKIY